MNDTIIDTVRERYGDIARSGLSSEQQSVRAVAEAFGYTPEELASIPAEANMALSCGNPTATANIREGETVVDLGSGGGLDVFLAARKVGPTGRAVGIDMTPEMVELARRNAAKRLEEGAPDNVEFHLSTIDAIPLEDGSADLVISNCVINLAPDKPAVFREMARILKPGGRVAISDIALKRPLPPEVRDDLRAYVGCVAGAVSIEEYRRGLEAAGFAHVEIVDTHADLSVYATDSGDSTGCCSPAPAGNERRSSALPVASGSGCCTPRTDDAPATRGVSNQYDVNAYAASVRVFAVKAPAV